MWFIASEENINYLAHHGIKGQKWGIRRYQNEDGSLTSKGVKRYAVQNKTQKAKSFNNNLRLSHDANTFIRAIATKNIPAWKKQSSKVIEDIAKNYNTTYKQDKNRIDIKMVDKKDNNIKIEATGFLKDGIVTNVKYK